MEQLITPFGEIRILIDQNPVSYIAQEYSEDGEPAEGVLGRYQIAVRFRPDGRKHTVACIFDSDQPEKIITEDFVEDGSVTFFTEPGYMMLFLIDYSSGFMDRGKPSDYHDYGAACLKNGIAYIILPETRTEHYTFLIGWTDKYERTDLPHDEDGDDTVLAFG